MDDSDLLLWFGGLYLLRQLLDGGSVNEAMKRGGASAYEALHPNERNHANDLPGHQMTRAAVEQLARRVGFPDPHLAMAIAFAESGGVPNAKGDGGRSIGLWQINTHARPQFTVEAMADPLANARAAFEISKGGTDWSDWSAFNSGKFRRFV